VKLKVILLLLILTVAAAFYSQSVQMTKLEDRIEYLENEVKAHDKTFKEVYNIFRIIIKEIEKTSKFIA